MSPSSTSTTSSSSSSSRSTAKFSDCRSSLQNQSKWPSVTLALRPENERRLVSRVVTSSDIDGHVQVAFENDSSIELSSNSARPQFSPNTDISSSSSSSNSGCQTWLPSVQCLSKSDTYSPALLLLQGGNQQKLQQLQKLRPIPSTNTR